MQRFDLEDPNIVVLIDEGRCATRMAYEHRALYATREAGADPIIGALVAAVDAVDLWRKDRPEFRFGASLDEVFWDNVSNLVPIGHPWHDRFVSDLLLGAARLLSEGATRRRSRPGCRPCARRSSTATSPTMRATTAASPRACASPGCSPPPSCSTPSPTAR